MRLPDGDGFSVKEVVYRDAIRTEEGVSDEADSHCNQAPSS